jgi:protein required for attachment to host cells
MLLRRPSVQIPPNVVVLVGDGRKALFLRNIGDAEFPNLRMEEILSRENPPTREHGADRPTRVFQSIRDGRRSAADQQDWHELQEHAFAREVTDALAYLVRGSGATSLIIVAPPKTLAQIRKLIDSDVAEKICREVDKDLTKHPISEIERLLLAAE